MSAPPPPDDTLSDDGLEGLFASLEPRLGHRRRRLRRAGFHGPHASPGPLARDRRASARSRRHGRSRPAAGSGRRGCLRGARGGRPRAAPSHPRLDRRQAVGRASRRPRARRATAFSSAMRPGGGRLPPRHRPYPRRPGRDGDDAPLPRLRPRRVSPACGRKRTRQGIRHARPLLDWPKARLLDLCHGAGLAFRRAIPRTRTSDFARVRWRKLMPLLAERGADGRAPRTARGAGRPGRRGPRRQGAGGAWRAAEPVLDRGRPVLRGRHPCRGALRDRPAGAGPGPRPGRSRSGKQPPATGSKPARSGCARPSGPGRRCASPSPGRSCGWIMSGQVVHRRRNRRAGVAVSQIS